jgi:hypothetical protein
MTAGSRPNFTLPSLKQPGPNDHESTVVKVIHGVAVDLRRIDTLLHYNMQLLSDKNRRTQEVIKSSSTLQTLPWSAVRIVTHHTCAGLNIVASLDGSVSVVAGLDTRRLVQQWERRHDDRAHGGSRHGTQGHGHRAGLGHLHRGSLLVWCRNGRHDGRRSVFRSGGRRERVECTRHDVARVAGLGNGIGAEDAEDGGVGICKGDGRGWVDDR